MASEQQKRIRLELAASGLKFILREEPITRKSFFIPENTPIQADPAYSREIANVNWQRDFLVRLIDEKILAKGNSDGRADTFKVIDSQEIRRILKDHDKDGLMLAKHLFPGEVVLPVAISRVSDSEEEISEAEVSEALEERHTSNVGASVWKSGSEDEESDRALVIRKFDTIGGILSEVLNYLKDTSKEQNVIFGAISENLAFIRDDKFDEMESKLRGVKDEFNGVKKRLDKMETASNQLTGVQGSLNHNIKKLIEEGSNEGQAEEMATAVANALTPLADSVNELNRQMKTSDIRTGALQQSTNALVAYLKNAEDDKLGKVLKMLEQHVEDGKTIGDMLLDVKNESKET